MSPNDHLNPFKDIFGNLGPIPREPIDGNDDMEFHIWYDKLCDGTPKLRAETITMTPENFCKAMRQAWRAARDRNQSDRMN